MKKILLAAGLLSISSLAYGAACGAPTSVTTLGVSGCEVGSVSFANFSVTGGDSIVVGSQVYDPSNILVAIAFNGNTYTVTTTPVSPSLWELTGTQQFSFNLNYTITAPDVLFVGYRISLEGSSSGSGSASITKTSDGGQNPVNANFGQPISIFTTFAGPVSSLTVRDNVQVNASNGAATLLSFTNEFSIPEPGTYALIGTGLAAMAFVRRRRRS